jgi:predicted transcriptional regulator
LGREHSDKDELNTTDNKQRVYEYIIRYPGSHLRKISKDLSLAIGNVQYHVNLLEKNGLIKSRRMNFLKVYYAVSIFGERHEAILAVLRQETPREIVLYLIENPEATQTDISAYMGFAPASINWHMSRLIEIGLIRGHKDGRFIKYDIVGDVKEITAFLKSYYPRIWEKLSSRLADLFLDIAAASRSQEEKGDPYVE